MATPVAIWTTALKRLLADIEAGKVDCVVVYKVDRLSRSLMDFAKMFRGLRTKASRLRQRYAAVQYDQLHGTADVERPPIIRPV